MTKWVSLMRESCREEASIGARVAFFIDYSAKKIVSILGLKYYNK